MADSFYQLPNGVTHALIKHSFITGSVLVPFDPLSILSDQLRRHNFNVVENKDETNLMDPVWWVGQKEKKFDWVIAATTG